MFFSKSFDKVLQRAAHHFSIFLNGKSVGKFSKIFFFSFDSNFLIRAWVNFLNISSAEMLLIILQYCAMLTLNAIRAMVGGVLN